MSKRLAYADRFKRVLDATMDIPDMAGLVPFPVIDELENHTRYIWTADEWKKLISVVKTGADLTYPEEAQQILWSILRGMHLPQTFDEEEGDCYNYPPYVPFIDLFPMSPYINPLEIPSGYLKPPFQTGGGIGYEATDLIVPFDAFPLFANWYDIISGFLPQITITTVGSGQIEMDLLSIIQGGFCVMKSGSPPNILDIFLGIFEPDIRIIDLQTDVAFPAELDVIHSEELDINVAEGVEVQTYLTFIPSVDDAIWPLGLPLRFGGGLRRVGLCGFENAGVIMGITDLRLVGEKLETFEGGVWSEKVDLEPLHDAHDLALQVQITANDGDITALQGVDTSLQSQITANDGDISALQAIDVLHASDIIDLFAENDAQDILIQANADQNDAQDILIQANADQNDVQDALLLVLAGDIDTNETAITALNDSQAIQDILIGANSAENIVQNADIDDLELNDGIQDLILASHTFSILALNSTVSSKMKTTSYLIQIPSNTSYETDVWDAMNFVTQSHQFTYGTAQILAIFKARYDLGSPNFAEFRLNVDGDESAKVHTLAGTSQKDVYLSDVFTDLETAFAVNIGVDWRPDTDLIKVKTIALTNIIYTIVEYETGVLVPIVFPATETVDFDGGYPYTLLVGDITADGNPANCISRTGLSIGGQVEFEMDITGRLINNLIYDLHRKNGTVSVNVYVDGVPIVGISSGSYLDDAWTVAFSAISEVPLSFPLPAGDVLKIIVSKTGGGGSDGEIRFDNLQLVN